jgi:plastocyanin
MMLLRAARSALLIAALGAACGGSAEIAIAAAAPGHHAKRGTGGARRCHHGRHHRCPQRRAGDGRKRGHTHLSPAAAPKGGSGSSGSPSPGPWTPLPPAVGPGTGKAPGSPGGDAAPEESPSAPAAPAHVEVTAEDTQAFRFVLSRPSVPAGKVIIEFVNHGQDEHNLHVVEPAEGAESGALPNTAPNAHPSLTLDLRHGSYTFFCSLPGHEAAGMKATLVVN